MSFVVSNYLRHCLRLCPKISRKYSTDSSNILVGETVGIRTICINRPNKRNCLDSKTITELRRALNEFDQDDNFNVAVLYGEGGTFSSGYDLTEIAEKGYESLLEASDGMCDQPLTIKPLVAAINGFAVAEGFELALACDLRVVEHTAMLGALGRRYGVPMTLGGAKRLSNLIGTSRALDLVMAGQLIPANVANDFGLVSRIVSTGTSLGQAISLAICINKFPLNSVIHDKLETLHSTSTEKYKTYYKNNIKKLKMESLIESKTHAEKFINGIGKHGKSHGLTKKEMTSWEAEMELEINNTVRSIKKT